MTAAGTPYCFSARANRSAYLRICAWPLLMRPPGTMLVEIAIALLGRLSPQLPVMSLTVPVKTRTGFAILAGSMALWPRFIEARFSNLLDLAERLLGPAGAGR